MQLSHIFIGDWYYSKRGHLCRAETIDLKDNSVTVTNHYTGNLIKITSDQIEYLKVAPEPNTRPGTAMVDKAEKISEYYCS